VALCDERAQLVGLVTVERLLGRLADALDSSPVSRSPNTATPV
jgi:hypothetical protein